MKNKSGINYILINSTAFVFLFYLLNSLNVITPFINIVTLLFFSCIISYIIYPMYKFLSKRVNNILSIVLIYLIIIIFILYLIYSGVNNTNFIKNVVELFENIFKFINILNIKYNLNINIDLYLERIITFIINNSMNIIKNIIDYLSKFIFVIILSTCILINIDYIKVFISKMKCKSLIYNINDKLKNYLIANIKIIIVQFVEYTFIFYVIGHPNYLMLGIVNSINNFIPYIGSFITNVLAITTASVIDVKLLLLTSIVSIILPNIDAYFITPKIHKNTNNLPETLCIASVIIFGLLFGIIGVILAVPTLIIIIEVLKYKNIVKRM